MDSKLVIFRSLFKSCGDGSGVTNVASSGPRPRLDNDDGEPEGLDSAWAHKMIFTVETTPSGGYRLW